MKKQIKKALKIEKKLMELKSEENEVSKWNRNNLFFSEKEKNCEIEKIKLKQEKQKLKQRKNILKLYLIFDKIIDTPT